jgi:hypothetical protein
LERRIHLGGRLLPKTFSVPFLTRERLRQQGVAPHKGKESCEKLFGIGETTVFERG